MAVLGTDFLNLLKHGEIYVRIKKKRKKHLMVIQNIEMVDNETVEFFPRK